MPRAHMGHPEKETMLSDASISSIARHRNVLKSSASNITSTTSSELAPVVNSRRYLTINSKSSVEIPQCRPVTTAECKRDGRQVVGTVSRDFVVDGQRTRRVQHAEIMTQQISRYDSLPDNNTHIHKPLKLRAYGSIEICVLLLLLSYIFIIKRAFSR